MSYSSNALKALQQVKNSLLILYGANYFTDDDWATIDRIIHKGKYVFTNGPPANMLDDDEPFITFDETGFTAIESVKSKSDKGPTSANTSLSPNSGTTSPLTTTYTPVEEVPEMPRPEEVKGEISSWASKVGVVEGRNPQPAATTRLPHHVPPSYASSVHSSPLSSSSKWTLKNSKKRPGQSKGGSSPAPPPPPAGFNANSTYVASRPQDTLKSKIEVQPGDQVLLQQFISGTIYKGRNLRTKKEGFVYCTIFDLPQPASLQVTGADTLVHLQPPVQKDVSTKLDQKSERMTYSVNMMQSLNLTEWNKESASRKRAPSIDRVENSNAATWNEDPAPRPTPPKSPEVQTSTQDEWQQVLSPRKSSTVYIPPNARQGSLAVQNTSQNYPPDVQAKIDQAVRQIISEEVDGIHNTPSGPKSMLYSKSAKWEPPQEPITPKTWVCRFWYQGTVGGGDGCRFTDEECRDIHARVNDKGEPIILHPGKPTWAAVADYIPPLAHPTPIIGVDGEVIGVEPVMEEGMETKSWTCYFWAGKGCTKSESVCKFAHKPTVNGIAKTKAAFKARFPHTSGYGAGRNPWETETVTSWRRGVEGEATKEPTIDAWGQDAKPAHVLEQENKLAQQQVGW